MSTLYRKDFEAIARAVNDARIVAPSADIRASASTADYIAKELASVLAGSNERFDRARFLAACGVKP
jgi:hypothetical protein